MARITGPRLKNPGIIVVGDSFCSSPQGWPGLLAQKLGLHLINHGQGGQPWWNAKLFLDSLDKDTIDHADYLILVHTNSDRIPTNNVEVGLTNHARPDDSELAQAVHLYYKHIHSANFLDWTQQQWFLYIGREWAHKKLVHLHSFPWSVQHSKLLTGLNITTNLCSISLNELGAEKLELFNDQRFNHLNEYNNQVLADQLCRVITDWRPGSVNLDMKQFDFKTTRWSDWH